MKINKLNNFNNDVIFVDGLWGSGKSLLSPLLACLEDFEKPVIKPIFDQLSVLLNHKKISNEVADALFKSNIDQLIYEIQLGREVNFSLFDDTGLLKNPNAFYNLIKLFQRDIDYNSNSFKRKGIILLTHKILMGSNLLFTECDFKIKIIEVVRHPLYVYDHWLNYLNRFEDKKIFELSYYFEGVRVPWFAKEWLEDYHEYNIYDKTLFSIIYTYNILFENLLSQKNTRNVLVISFESIIFDTNNIMDKISKFASRKFTSSIKKTLKKQRIPRKTLSSGLGKTKYGFNEGSSDEEKDYKEKWNFIKLNCNTDLVNEFKSLINKYNRFFPSKLNYMNKNSLNEN